jgi:hypothetical protein
MKVQKVILVVKSEIKVGPSIGAGFDGMSGRVYKHVRRRMVLL